MTPLADLFPDGDYRFHLTLRRGEPREFFRPHDPSGRALAERARWLAADPARYAALRPEGAPLLAEFGELCAGWGLPRVDSVTALGAAFESDVLFLSPDADGAFRL